MRILISICMAALASFAACDANGSSYGACLFSVEVESMTMRYVSPSGAVRDSVSVRR